MLMFLGIIKEPIQWFTDKQYMLWLVIIVSLWMSLGAGFLSFVAGLRTIDTSYYEVGYIEGIRNRWQELWYITLPCLRPQMMFGAVMSITSAFTSGQVTMSLCGNPSTDYGAHTILNHLVDTHKDNAEYIYYLYDETPVLPENIITAINEKVSSVKLMRTGENVPFSIGEDGCVVLDTSHVDMSSAAYADCFAIVCGE